jgi:hypothetical protein
MLQVVPRPVHGRQRRRWRALPSGASRSPRAARCCSSPPRTRPTSYARVCRGSAHPQVSHGTASISTSSSIRSSASTCRPTARGCSPRSNACDRASSSSTPSSACTASMRTPPPRVAPLLAYLRELQRTLGCAVALVHHARKGGHARAGQALRGSSELHAWGDSNLYLRRDGERLLLSIEHRAAASSSGLELELADRGGGLTLHVREDIGAPTAERPRSPAERVPGCPRRRHGPADPPRAARHLPPAQRHPRRHPRRASGRRPRPRRGRPRPTRPHLTGSPFRFPPPLRGPRERERERGIGPLARPAPRPSSPVHQNACSRAHQLMRRCSTGRAVSETATSARRSTVNRRPDLSSGTGHAFSEAATGAATSARGSGRSRRFRLSLGTDRASPEAATEAATTRGRGPVSPAIWDRSCIRRGGNRGGNHPRARVCLTCRLGQVAHPPRRQPWRQPPRSHPTSIHRSHLSFGTGRAFCEPATEAASQVEHGEPAHGAAVSPAPPPKWQPRRQP